MFSKFLSVSGKNFLSIGNEEVEYRFENGFTSIVGKNGSGKSTIIDLISFILYGKVIRKVKQTNIINKTTKKDLLCIGEFEFNEQFVRVERGLKPERFEIFVGGRDEEHRVGRMSEKRDHQKELTKLIGIDYDIFKQVVVLSSTRSTKNFLELSSPEKKLQVSNIFNLSIVDEISKLASEKMKSVISDSRMLNDLLTSKHREKTSLTQLLNKLDISDEIAQLNTSVKTSKETLETLKSSLNAISVSETQVNSLSTQFKTELTNIGSFDEKHFIEVKTQVRMLTLRKNELVGRISKVNNLGSLCSECGQEISEEHIQNEVEKLNSSISEIDSTLVKLNSEFETLESVKTNIDRLGIKIDKCETQFKVLEKHRTQNEKDTLKLETDVKINEFKLQSLETDLEQQRVLNEKIGLIENEMVGIQVDIECKNELEKVYNTIAKNIMTDEGVKSYYINKFIPILNTQINKYIVDFELPFSIIFNGSFDYQLVSTLNNYTEFEYTQMSEGQKKRLDIAITFSFIDTLKTIVNWDSNLLVFDELFDSGVDSEGLDMILTNIKTIYYTGDRNKEIIIISHKNSDEMTFMRNVVCELVSGCSTYKFN